jgi:hypothetical protein
MVKRAKNPAQLTEQEKDIVDQVILKWGAAHAYMISIYPTPKGFAQFLISTVNTKKGITTLYLAAVNSRRMEIGRALSPADLNKLIATIMLDKTVSDTTDMTTNVVRAHDIDTYINSTDMTKILHRLASAGVYQNIEGKDEVRRQSRRIQKGRPEKSDKTPTKPLGRPSVYKLSERVEKLRALMSKPEASDRLRKALNRLAYENKKFILQAMYYAARDDKSAVEKLFRVVNHDPIKIPKLKEFLELFCASDESQLDEITDKFAKIIVENSSGGSSFTMGLSTFPSPSKLNAA